jgi:hypothetical protein
LQGEFLGTIEQTIKGYFLGGTTHFVNVIILHLIRPNELDKQLHVDTFESKTSVAVKFQDFCMFPAPRCRLPFMHRPDAFDCTMDGIKLRVTTTVLFVHKHSSELRLM